MSVMEAVDPQSALTAPDVSADANFAGELRMNCGLLLGGFDWLISQIFDYSPLQEWVIKPFSGDWEAFRRAQGGWANAASATRGVSQNFSSLATQTAETWQGRSGDAFRARMTSLSEGFDGYAEGCDQLSGVAGGLVQVSKSTASVIAIAIGFIGQQLERIAAQLAVPVVGWVSGAAYAVAKAKPIYDKAVSIFNAIKKLVAALKDVIAAVRALAITLGITKNLLNSMAGGQNIDNAADSDEASRNNFGV